MCYMDEELIGMNAGKIWNALHHSGPLTKHQLIIRTQLSESQLDAAIGWLARENKIKKNGAFFCLDETNLTESIGKNAGTLFSMLQQLPNDVSVLSMLTDFKKEDLHLAMGWLAKEGNLMPQPDQMHPAVQQSQEMIHNLNEEIQTLHQDIQHRNEIITELTTQLTEKQTQFIKRSDVIDTLNKQLSTHKKIKPVTEDITDVQEHIGMLTEEIHSLHDELINRNQIIQHLTTQLNEKQEAFIERSDALDRLQSSLCQHKTQGLSNVTTDIQHRINTVESLQENLEYKQQHVLSSQAEKSMLINKHTPTITLDAEEHQEICQQLNNVLHQKNQVESLSDSIEQVCSDHSKKDINNHKNSSE